VAIPLIDGMLRRAQSIAIALELKAFNPANKNRTFYYQHWLTTRDVLFLFSGVLLLGLCVAINLLGWGRVEAFL
jgi:energy-coupling factor transporter transmembrane protein EcfT